MMKKLFLLAVAAILVGIATLPWWTDRMAEQAFARPEAPTADGLLFKAVRLKVLMLNYETAGQCAEKGVIYFPESPYLPDFLFVAATAAEKGNRPEAAIHWYTRFLELYPNHQYGHQAKSSLEKLKGIHQQ